MLRNDRDGSTSVEQLYKVIDLLQDANKALLVENERLSEQVQELDSFAQAAAHDLMTPISSIRLQSSMIRKYYERYTSEQIIGAADSIFDASKELEEMLSAILLFSRAGGDHQLMLHPIDMHSVIEKASNRLHKVIKRSGAHVRIADEWPLVMGYEPWVEQIWMNYISNAVKYGGEPPVIEIGCDAVEGGYAVFWVRDNGVGLDEVQQERIFQPYIRMHHDKADGHGLGLAIVARIANKLGGDVGVESIPDGGSTFKFMLPVVES